MDNNFYIISGCNGAGKTTASFTILPDVIECKEFVNADEIARGLSPFQPEKVRFEAGRIMLERINELFVHEESFAIETTLATKSYRHKIQFAKDSGYDVTLLFFWLNSIDLAINRVRTRVKEGGHNIPKDDIVRRYKRGIVNLFDIYLPLVDEVLIFDNSEGTPDLLAKKSNKNGLDIVNTSKFDLIKIQYEEYRINR